MDEIEHRAHEWQIPKSPLAIQAGADLVVDNIRTNLVVAKLNACHYRSLAAQKIVIDGSQDKFLSSNPTRGIKNFKQKSQLG